LVPSAVRRAFTLRQFARLSAAGAEVEVDTHAAVGGLLERAALGRTRVQPVGEADDTIEDPLGKDLAAFRQCAEVTAGCIEAILRPLTIPV
jgi:hypothetical protein